jgi:hypothetical protein
MISAGFDIWACSVRNPLTPSWLRVPVPLSTRFSTETVDNFRVCDADYIHELHDYSFLHASRTRDKKSCGGRVHLRCRQRGNVLNRARVERSTSRFPTGATLASPVFAADQEKCFGIAKAG